MKSIYSIFIYILWSMHLSFCMEDMGQYYEDFNIYNNTVEKIYDESKKLRNIQEQLAIAKMVLAFYEAQKTKSAYNDQRFFYDQQLNLAEKLKEAKEKDSILGLEKCNSLNKKSYFVEDDFDNQDDYDIAQNGSFKDQLANANQQIKSILDSNQYFSTIIKTINSKINVFLEKQKIDLLQNVKIDSKQQNGSLFDKLLYAEKLLTTIDKNIVDLKEKGITNSIFESLAKELCLATDNVESIAKKTGLDQAISLKSKNILQKENNEKKILEENCVKAQEHKDYHFIYSWDDFCSWKKNEMINFPEQNGTTINFLIEKYIEHKVDKINNTKDKLFNYYRNFTIHYDKFFNTELSNEQNVQKAYDQFSTLGNFIISFNKDKLILLSESEQEYCIEHLLKSVGLLFVQGINFLNDIAILPFDELLFLGSIFYDHQQSSGNVIPSGYITDYIQNPNQKRKTPLESIQIHCHNYRMLKKFLFPTYTYISPNQSLVLHSLARVRLQDAPIADQDLMAIKKILEQSTPENQGPLLGSVYGFCRFINKYTYDKSNGLLTESKGRLEPFFDTWHAQFRNSFNSAKPNFESHAYEAIDYLIRKNPLLNKHFKLFLNDQGYNNNEQKDEDDVLKNKTYGGGLSWGPNGPKKFFTYNKKLLDYVINVIKMTKPIVNNRKINDDHFFEEGRALYDAHVLECKNNKKQIQLYTDFIKCAEKANRSTDDAVKFLGKHAEKNIKKEFEQYKKNNPEIDLADITYAYSILMTGRYMYSVASPSVFPENTSLPEFAEKYKKALLHLNELQNFEKDNQQHRKQDFVLELMFINWWKVLYKPTPGQTLEEYLALKPSLLEKAFNENDYKKQLASECSIGYLLEAYIHLAKESVEGLKKYNMLKKPGSQLYHEAKEGNNSNPKDNYILYAAHHQKYGNYDILNYFKQKVFTS